MDTVAVEERLRGVARVQLRLFVRDAIGRKSFLEGLPNFSRKFCALSHAFQEFNQRVTVYKALGAPELDDARDSLEDFDSVLDF